MLSVFTGISRCTVKSIFDSSRVSRIDADGLDLACIHSCVSDHGSRAIDRPQT